MRDVFEIFEDGVLVQTNNEYFRQYGRRVFGVVVEVESTVGHVEMLDSVTFIKCNKQEGNAMLNYYNNIIMLESKFLEKVK